MLLSLINIGSSTALSAILALTTFSLYLSYIIPIVMLVLKRLRVSSSQVPSENELPLVFGPWTMGRYGVFVNVYAILFGTLVCIFVPFPPIVPVTARNMNYSGPVFGLLLVLLIIDWLSRGRRRYEGPLKLLLEFQQSGMGDRGRRNSPRSGDHRSQ